MKQNVGNMPALPCYDNIIVVRVQERKKYFVIFSGNINIAFYMENMCKSFEE